MTEAKHQTTDDGRGVVRYSISRIFIRYNPLANLKFKGNKPKGQTYP